MAEVTNGNGHDKESNPPKKQKRLGKWADPEYKRAYSRKWYAKRKKMEAKEVKPKGKKKTQRHGQYDDAMIYLRMGERSINERLASGELAKEDMAHLLLKLALKTLQGEK